ncbi:hypothetical protein PTT_06519 [Pyrenophora teres f. teres 0-1]|uniref:Uncharacterized protein n=1 Tax=Pyrenophora teres f. teres (strain 0-1) TaxID=861557 RepID=E3RFL3_PYRTT|nr:hypothetical protein PTT_06519 [Pyrenophora teres f. teres 0-1]
MKSTFYFAVVALFAPSVLGHCLLTGNGSAGAPCKKTYACDRGSVPPGVCGKYLPN